MKNKYRLRVENCIGTIIEVHKKAISHQEDQTFLSQFQKLKEVINGMDMSEISEQDVLMVEQATNVLLGEFKPVFDSKKEGAVHSKNIH